MPWPGSPITQLFPLDSILTGVSTNMPVVGHDMLLQGGEAGPQTLSVTLQIRTSTARQFDYYLETGRDASRQIVAQAVAIAMLRGAYGVYLNPDAWDRYVLVTYEGKTFRGQALTRTVRYYKND